MSATITLGADRSLINCFASTTQWRIWKNTCRSVFRREPIHQPSPLLLSVSFGNIPLRKYWKTLTSLERRYYNYCFQLSKYVDFRNFWIIWNGILLFCSSANAERSVYSVCSAFEFESQRSVAFTGYSNGRRKNVQSIYIVFDLSCSANVIKLIIIYHLPSYLSILGRLLILQTDSKRPQTFVWCSIS